MYVESPEVQHEHDLSDQCLQTSSDMVDVAICLMSYSATKVEIRTAPCHAVSRIPPIHVQLMQPPALISERHLFLVDRPCSSSHMEVYNRRRKEEVLHLVNHNGKPLGCNR